MTAPAALPVTDAGAGPPRAKRAPVAAEVESLTAAVAAGDEQAVTRFYRSWFDAMYADARGATGRDESFCLDVVQDAMMRVIRTIRPMPGEDDLRRWLRAVVWSCACDRLRAEARRQRRERQAFEAQAGRGCDGDPDPQDLETRLRWIAAQISALDDRSARLLLMRHRLGWTLERIGRALSMKPGAVHGRLLRLVGMLRRRARSLDDE